MVRDLKASFSGCVMLLMVLCAIPTFAADAPFGQPQVYKTVDSRELKVFISKPADWKAGDHRPCIVFFHGGGWVGGSPDQFDEQSKHFVTRGAVVVQVEYRLLKGEKGPPTHCCNDAKSAMRWVRSHAGQLGIDPNRIASGGGSAGGHLAAFVGMVEGMDDPADDKSVSPKSNAMLLFNPVFNNGPGGWGASRVGDRYKEFSPAHNVSADDPPAVVFLGDSDKLIPVKIVEDFKAQMEKAGVQCRIFIYPGQGHGFFNPNKGGSSEYFQKTLAEADKFLTDLGWLPKQ